MEESASNRLITEVFRQPLTEYLSMVPGFLAQMVQSNLITIDQNEKISNVLAHRGSRDATQLLLQLIHKRHKFDVTSQFVIALRQSGDATNTQLADLIEGNSSIPEYDKEHRLIKKYYQRLQDLNPADMIPYLTYIDPDDQQSILCKCEIGHSNLARSTLLHLTVRTLEPRWFEIFLYALEQTGHRRVAEHLKSDFQTEEAETTMETQGGLTAPPGCRDEDSLSLNSLSLDDCKEERSSPQDLRCPGASTSGMQHSDERQQDGQSQAMGPPTCNSTIRDRSRSSSKRSRQGTNSRESSRSPKRPRTYQEKMNQLKRQRSRSRENKQQGPTYNKTIIQQNIQNNYVNNTVNNTANITNSQHVQAMVGGESNTVNFGSQGNGRSPMPGREAEVHQDARPGGEDQPDHAKMPREDDVRDAFASPSDDGYASPRRAKSSIPKTERPHLYEDQLELAEDAVGGENTVLVAPTGSGKTHVAAYIIHDHFIADHRPKPVKDRRALFLVNTVAPTGSGKTHVAAYIIHDHFIADRPKPVKDRRALFLVNTVNLVRQQQDKLKSLLQPAGFFSVTGIHGASELSLQEEVANRNVIVLTAQLLENALKCIPLERFSLLVFDECHLCQKGHAYNTIMVRYLDEKLQGNANLPQVIGMTASLGTDKAKEQSDADNHAIHICANMDAHSISMVSRNLAVLEARVNIPEEVEPIEVKCREYDPFADKINVIMSQIEIMLRESPSPEVRSLVDNETMPIQRGSQAYRQWCDRMKRSSQIFIQNEEKELYRMLLACINHLMEYNTSLLINKQIRTKDAFNHLHQMMDTMNDRRGCFDGNDRKLWSLYVDEERNLEQIKDDSSNENPLLEKLSQIILEEYGSRPHSRAILFVKTIDTTEALQDWIMETPDLEFLNPGRIAGSRDMTSEQQNKVIELFRSGEHKMLVATNLLEQGTDVPACNLVIRLDYVRSDFGHVQIKGRTRAKDGRSYLITLVDSNGAARDATNRRREAMMMEAARRLKDKTQEEFLDLTRRRQKSDLSERQARQEQKRDILQDNMGEVFIFCCINCSTDAFRSYDVRIFYDSQFLIVDPGFSKRVKLKEHPKPKKLGKDFTVIGKMFCKICGHDWGALTRIQDSYYSSVRIAQFSLKNLETGKAHTYKKWKDVPFGVEQVTELPPEARVNVPIDVLKKLRKL